MAMIFSSLKETDNTVKSVNQLLAKAAASSKVDPAQDAAWIAEGKKATSNIPTSLQASVSEEAAARQAQEARATQQSSVAPSTPKKP